MQKALSFGATVTVLALGLVLQASEKPSAEFQQAMKDAGATLQKLGKDVEANDYAAISADAATVSKIFSGTVAAYFETAMIADASAKTSDAVRAAEALDAAAMSKDAEAVARARTTLQGTCGACHREHREQMPDKSYMIK